MTPRRTAPNPYLWFQPVGYLHIAGWQVDDWAAFPEDGRLAPAIEAAESALISRLTRQFGERARQREGGRPPVLAQEVVQWEGGPYHAAHVPGYRRTSDAFSPTMGGRPGDTALAEASRAFPVAEIVCRLGHT